MSFLPEESLPASLPEELLPDPPPESKMPMPRRLHGAPRLAAALKREPEVAASPISHARPARPPSPPAAVAGTVTYVPRSSGVPNTKVPYTEEEDRVLTEYVLARAQAGQKVSGNKIYQELEEQVSLLVAQLIPCSRAY